MWVAGADSRNWEHGSFEQTQKLKGVIFLRLRILLLADLTRSCCCMLDSTVSWTLSCLAWLFALLLALLLAFLQATLCRKSWRLSFVPGDKGFLFCALSLELLCCFLQRSWLPYWLWVWGSCIPGFVVLQARRPHVWLYFELMFLLRFHPCLDFELDVLCVFSCKSASGTLTMVLSHAHRSFCWAASKGWKPLQTPTTRASSRLLQDRSRPWMNVEGHAALGLGRRLLLDMLPASTKDCTHLSPAPCCATLATAQCKSVQRRKKWTPAGC